MALKAIHPGIRTCNVNEKGIRAYTWSLVVESTITNDDPFTVGTYLGVDFYDPWPSDSGALFRNADIVQRADNMAVWNVTLNYDNTPLDVGQLGTGAEPGAPSGEPGQSNQSQTPTSRPPQLSIDTVEIQTPCTKTIFGKPVVASNGQPYDPAITIPTYQPQFTFQCWKAIGDDGYGNVMAFVGKINSRAWNGFAKWTLLCKKYSLQSQYEQGNWFWQKTVVLQGKSDGWNPVEVLDQGTHFRSGPDGNHPPQPILDLSGNVSTTPMPLNGHGKPLNRADIIAGNLKFNKFHLYKRVNFANIL